MAACNPKHFSSKLMSLAIAITCHFGPCDAAITRSCGQRDPCVPEWLAAYQRPSTPLGPDKAVHVSCLNRHTSSQRCCTAVLWKTVNAVCAIRALEPSACIEVPVYYYHLSVTIVSREKRPTNRLLQPAEANAW